MKYLNRSFTLPTGDLVSQRQWDFSFLSKEEFEAKYGINVAEYPKKVRSCNRHSDCDEAEIKRFGKIDYYPNFHCHDDECEDCFGC